VHQQIRASTLRTCHTKANPQPEWIADWIHNRPESIQKDFTVDKPSWPLSSYGVAKNEPTFLTGLDVSPEELRVQAVLALKDGKIQDYVRPPLFQ